MATAVTTGRLSIGFTSKASLSSTDTISSAARPHYTDGAMGCIRYFATLLECEQPSPFLILIEVDIPLVVHPDSTSTFTRAGCRQAQPLGSHLSAKGWYLGPSKIMPSPLLTLYVPVRPRVVLPGAWRRAGGFDSGGVWRASCFA